MLKKLIVIENGQDYQFDSKEELVKAMLDENYYEMTDQEKKKIIEKKAQANCAVAKINNPKFRNMKFEEIENMLILKNEITYILSLLRLGNLTILERKDANIFTKNIDKSNIKDNYIMLNYYIENI